ncbi:MAG: hypothetical protein KC621_15255, partial [Myxococcales bacterium]|nr:hypothetical protein [Myxococcales bacterium]
MPTKTKPASAIDKLLESLPERRPETKSLEAILDKLSEEDRREAYRILYGDLPEKLTIPDEVARTAEANDYEVSAWRFVAAREQRRPPRTVRVGVIQNQVIKPTDAPVEEQYEAIADRVEEMIAAAAAMGTNVLGLQEAWTMPFA